MGEGGLGEVQLWRFSGRGPWETAAVEGLGCKCVAERSIPASTRVIEIKRNMFLTYLRSFFRSAPLTLWDWPKLKGFLNMAS